jgi:methylenetetrahydrofolate dehydrogenase (NADP+) / methenyltetrahydrofolate cyclohydrolase
VTGATRTTAGAVLMDGTALAREIRERLAGEVADFSAGTGVVPCLATVLVGGDPASRLYVGKKHKEAEAAGMVSRHAGLAEKVSQAEVEDAVAALAADPSVHGILVQLPLPGHLEVEPVLDLLPATKDVDGLTATNLGWLLRGRPVHAPCTPRGIMRLLARYGVATGGRRAVIIGRLALVGLPLALLLGRKGTDATVTVAHSRTADLAAEARSADILVAAAGRAEMVRADWVKPGACVVDVGVTRTEAGIRGDVAFDEVSAVAGALTPMPGGTGPMTVACLLENTLAAARLQALAPVS